MSLHLAGGKGVNLNQMLRAGLPVPPGFIILTTAYQRFVADNALASLIHEQWHLCDAAQPASFEAAAHVLHIAFADGKIADDLAVAIQAQYTGLGKDVAVAVRSSATAEDLPEASFAGQQDTYVNVRGESAVLEAVQRCWASLWTARAMAYRLRQAVSPQEVSLAVVIQQMVPASAAGILFTANPVTGDPGEMVINATWGLGEALVSGQVTPDMLVLDKATAAIKQTILGDKLVMTTATDRGTAETPVATDQQRRQVLDTTQINELVRLGNLLEAQFGKPQDVEWAIADGTISLLQARPITTSGAPIPGLAAPGDDHWPPPDMAAQPFDLWTTYDVGERWPEPVTPFSWSTGYAMIQQNMEETLEGLRAPYAGKIQWSKRAYGHVYLNEGALTYAYNDGLGLPMGMIAPTMTGVVAVTPENDRYQWSKLVRHLRFFRRSLFQAEKDVKRYMADFAQIDGWVAAFMARSLAGPADSMLWREANEVWLARAMHYMRAHGSATSLSLTTYSQLEQFTQRWTGEKNLTPKLVSGLSGVIAAEIAPALWQLARQIEAAGMADVVANQPPEAALAALRSTLAAQPVLAHFDAFLARHGHRCMSEAEWLHPRWVESPQLVVESIAGYLRAGDSFDPATSAAKAERERIEATSEIAQRLNLVQRAYFYRLLKRAQRLMLARDNGQHYLVKLMLPVRRLYATLAERWARRGWLAQKEDFYFLVLEEVAFVLKHNGDHNGAAGAQLDLVQRVASRRQAYDFWFGKAAPDVLDADGEIVEFQAAREQSTEGLVLIGLAASRGQVTGVARVVLTPQEAAAIQPGEILVTRATDPGWTPVFSVIGGAVIEIGSTLSHAAIVAREYGLPAVVNIPQATHLIRDGQKIRVDGNRGRVTLLE